MISFCMHPFASDLPIPINEFPDTWSALFSKLYYMTRDLLSELIQIIALKNYKYFLFAFDSNFLVLLLYSS